MTKPLKKIPTNIITGFLGVGKTTAISHLLRIKPEQERWAILVNEFGEIGIDGSLLLGQHGDKEQIFVAEVPGGCMCCVMGVPTKVALNKLLKQAKPDRLLIEPTGLGHPKEVLELLASEHYQEVLDIRTTLTLVDARVISDSRYTQHDIFNQQLLVADLIVANKSDCYDDELHQLTAYLGERRAEKPCPVVAVEQGQIELEWLDQAQAEMPKQNHQHHHHAHTSETSIQPLPPEGYVEISNHKGEYFSRGWRFNDEWLFDEAQLNQALNALTCERMKAVFNTTNGAKGYSLSQGELTEINLIQAQGNRIELIDRTSHRLEGFLPKLLDACSRFTQMH